MFLCPIQIWKLYTSKLNPKINSLWQNPRSGKIFYDDKEWYEAHVVGKDAMERFMKFLPDDLNLSIPYTNHSIRTTVTLDGDGFKARHIMKLSSYKNEATIKEYSVKCPDSKKREMCDSLSNAILPKHIKKASPTCTVSVNPDTNTIDINDVTQNLPIFDLELMENFDTMDDAELVNLIYETRPK